MAADLLVAGSHDGRMAVWNLADRQLVHLLLGHTGESPEPHPSSARWRDVTSCVVSYLKVLFWTSK